MALAILANKHSRDETYESPYSREAIQQAGITSCIINKCMFCSSLAACILFLFVSNVLTMQMDFVHVIVKVPPWFDALPWFFRVWIYHGGKRFWEKSWQVSDNFIHFSHTLWLIQQVALQKECSLCTKEKCHLLRIAQSLCLIEKGCLDVKMINSFLQGARWMT